MKSDVTKTAWEALEPKEKRIRSTALREGLRG